MSTESRRVTRAARCAALACLGLLANVASAQDLAPQNRTQVLVQQALHLMPDSGAGERAYKQFCASCHGLEAHGAPDTVTPALAGQLLPYLVRELVDMAEANRVATEMHRLVARKELSSAQAISNVAHYINELPRETRPQVGSGQSVPLGKRIYESECMQCHGVQAEGDAGAGVPALQAQHYAYLLLQTRQMPVSHGYDIGVETLERFEELQLQELEAVCDYISRLRVDANPDQVVRAGNPVKPGAGSHARDSRTLFAFHVPRKL